jgi:thiol-disulfide isomerase/thioredoxin
MQSDPGAEWERLTRLYREKSDEELLELGEDFGNLTDVAQQVLRDEMKKRGLTGAQLPSQAPKADGRPIFGRWNQAMAEQNRESDARGAQSAEADDDPPVEYTWKTLLRECDNQEEAWQLSEMLRRAKIESWIEAPQQRSLDNSGPRVVVAADQLEEARAIAARPIPQDIIDQSKTPVEDFQPPTCPKCRAADPMLEAIEPSNTWICESCGARWSDPVGPENDGQNSAGNRGL